MVSAAFLPWPRTASVTTGPGTKNVAVAASAALRPTAMRSAYRDSETVVECSGSDLAPPSHRTEPAYKGLASDDAHETGDDECGARRSAAAEVPKKKAIPISRTSRSAREDA